MEALAVRSAAMLAGAVGGAPGSEGQMIGAGCDGRWRGLWPGCWARGRVYGACWAGAMAAADWAPMVAGAGVGRARWWLAVQSRRCAAQLRSCRSVRCKRRDGADAEVAVCAAGGCDQGQMTAGGWPCCWCDGAMRLRS
ncbi:hypothetical protein Taro_030488 [Colocasia esculenta]|uniref:Uncharacterized protein n=1 Tax=Colocasia esculenta TaxID=4460 RepID=A0A843VLI7_COLES|nr:hypothetical protein [Colocasia esculenta]